MRVAINFLRFPNLFPTRTTCSLGGSFALKLGGAGVEGGGENLEKCFRFMKWKKVRRSKRNILPQYLTGTAETKYKLRKFEVYSVPLSHTPN